MRKEGRPEAAAVIWTWSERAPSATPAFATGRNRVVGTLQGLGALAVGSAIFLLWSRMVGTVVLSVGTIVLLSALISPGGLYLAVRGTFAALGHATGTALSWLLLVPIFYLVFLPFGLLLRRGRADRLKRYFERDADSYWEIHPERIAANPHERQY